MSIAEALRATSQEHDLSPEAIAVAAKVSAQGAKNWLALESPATPSGDALVRLMQAFPTFALRLGFSPVSAEAVA